MTLLEAFALAHAAGLGLFCLAAFAVSLRRYARRCEPGELSPMTLIRPLKGLDEGLEENLRAPLDADAAGALEVLFALESEKDAAYAVAARVAASAPGRARVVLTGPSGARMGKAHNMIEALKHATRDIIVFSDSDARPTRKVLVETARAFAAGAEAVSGLPDASMARAPGDVLVCLCFNHYFDPLATAGHAAGLGTFFSGTWMALSRDALKRVGGLERFSNEAADDFALADALRRKGARVALLPCLVPLYERGGTIIEGARHILKWARIVRWTVTAPYLLLPLATPLPLALVAACSAPSDLRPAAFWLFLAATRIACAVALDRRTAASRFPWWGYAALPFLDVGFLGLWLASWLGRTISWRGSLYRVFPGGRLERMTATLLLSLTLAATAADATKITAPRVPAERRSEIEALRFSKGFSSSEVKVRFLKNLERDCTNWAYGAEDADLTVEAVFSTYPEGAALRLLRRHAPSLCVQNAVVALRTLRGRFPRETAAVAIDYASRMPKGCPTTELLRLFEGACSAGARGAFAASYCRCKAELQGEIESAKGQTNPFASLSPTRGPAPEEVARDQMRRALVELLDAFDRVCPTPKTSAPDCK